MYDLCVCPVNAYALCAHLVHETVRGLSTLAPRLFSFEAFSVPDNRNCTSVVNRMMSIMPDYDCLERTKDRAATLDIVLLSFHLIKLVSSLVRAPL
jgi:hypothetical protein